MPEPSEEVNTARAKELVFVPDAVEDALKYLPEEAPRKSPLPDVRQLDVHVPTPSGVQASLAVTVYAINGVTLPYRNAGETVEVKINYKISRSQRPPTGTPPGTATSRKTTDEPRSGQRI